MKIVKGVQLPPDSTGSITGGFEVEEIDDNGDDIIIVIPATVVVDGDGEEIMSGIASTLGEINHRLETIVHQNHQIIEALTR